MIENTQCKYNFPIHSGIIFNTDENVKNNGVSIDVNELHIKEHKSMTVNLPSTKAMVEGWQIVPKKYPPFEYKNGKKYFKYKNVQVSLTELPSHLFHKLRNMNNDHDNEYVYVIDGIYKYKVELSDFNNEIIKLHFLSKKEILAQQDIDWINDLLDILRENGFKGWLVEKFKKIEKK